MERISADRRECEYARAQFDSLFGCLENLPFSFEYGGKTYQGFDHDFAVEQNDNRITAYHADGQLAVTVKIARYDTHAAFEWTVSFQNRSGKNSQILRQVKAADVFYAGDNSLLYTCNGDMCDDPYTHQPQQHRLNAGSVMEFEPEGGRGTNFQFPIYRLVTANTSVFISVGWPGQWESRFHARQGRLHFTAGQAAFNAWLEPGEEIRTPLISLLYHSAEADENRAANLWRRWFIDCNMRKIDGGNMPPALSGTTAFLYVEMTQATDENQIAAIKAYTSHGIELDYWWMDAGWYFKQGREPIQSWVETGSWQVDTHRFPSQLKSISDFACTNNAKTMLWFEPERVTPGTYLGNKSEWLLNGSLADMGNPECREWIIGQVDQVLTEGGISLYRQDYNIDPLTYWQWGDRQKGEGREGITENLYVQGYLAYWDELIARHPDMMIDSCASGGRRNDLETMRRAIPIHKTDADYSNQNHKQAIHHTLYRWYPYFGTLVVGWGNPTVDDTYAFRSSYVPWIALPFDVRRTDLEYPVIRRHIAEWDRIKDLFYAEYYMLTPWTNKLDAWIGWMFFDPDQEKGFIQAFRRDENGESEKILKLYCLAEDALYQLEDFDGGISEDRGGSLMHDGITVRADMPRSAKLILITRIDGRNS